MNETAESRGYANPVVAGFCLGLLLLAAFLLVGQGLGASGAFASGAAAAVHAVSPVQADSRPYLQSWIPVGRAGILGDWTVLELLGVVVGAWLSARLAGRIHRGVESVASESSRTRLVHAAVGGLLMGGGARLAHGCTSGLALTGGALLSTGAWLFIPAAFATAFAVSFAMRRVAGAAS